MASDSRGGEEISLTAAQEAALDAAWDEIAAEKAAANARAANHALRTPLANGGGEEAAVVFGR